MNGPTIDAFCLLFIIIVSGIVGGLLHRLFFVAEVTQPPRVRIPPAGIARVAHEANRALCAAFGDLSHKSWLNAEPHVKQSTLEGVKHLLASPHLTPEQMHENWCATKLAQGYRCGPVKCHRSRLHPCLVSYDELPPEQRIKDHLFHAIVKLFASS